MVESLSYGSAGVLLSAAGGKRKKERRLLEKRDKMNPLLEKASIGVRRAVFLTLLSPSRGPHHGMNQKEDILWSKRGREIQNERVRDSVMAYTTEGESVFAFAQAVFAEV